MAYNLKIFNNKSFLVGICLIILSITIAIICAFCLVFVTVEPSERMIVIDAGSSRTTAYAYKFGGFNRLKSPIELDTQKCGGSIHLVIDQPASLKALFEKCINKLVEDNFKNVDKSSIIIYLGATGGMRDRCKNEPILCNTFGELIENAIQSIGFKIIKSNADVLTGTEEALLGWIAVNDAYNRFGKDDKVQLFGSIDMGGSSMETAYDAKTIDFTVDGTTQKIESTIIDRHVYSVVSSILDCSGQDQTLNIFNTLIYNEQAGSEGSNEKFKNPCMPTSYSSIYNVSKMTNNICVSQFLLDFSITNDYLIEGSQDFQQCMLYLEKFFGTKSSCDSNYLCRFKDINYTIDNVLYVAYSSFYYFAKDLDIRDSENSLTLYETQLRERCFVEPERQSFEVSKYCAGMAYGYYTLKSGFALKEGQIRFYNKDSKLSWVRGLALRLKSTTPLSEKDNTRAKIGLSAGTILCLFLALLGVLILIHTFIELSKFSNNDINSEKLWNLN